MKYAVIKDDQVIDTVLWDGVTEWEYPFPHDELIQSDELGIGMCRDENGEWYYPEQSYLDSGFSEEYPPEE